MSVTDVASGGSAERVVAYQFTNMTGPPSSLLELVTTERTGQSAVVDAFREIVDFNVGEDADLRLLALKERAAEIARADSYGSVPARPLPELTGRLVDDVKAFTGLTHAEIAAAAGVTERTVANWKDKNRVPRENEPLLKALIGIAGILIGGLGADGVRRWLNAGSPPRLGQIYSGNIQSVIDDARRYEHSDFS